MQFNTFLTFALAVFFGLPSLGLTLPAGDDVANYPGRRGSFSLLCPSHCDSSLDAYCNDNGVVIGDVCADCICWPKFSGSPSGAQPNTKSVQSFTTSVFDSDGSTHVSTALSFGPTNVARSDTAGPSLGRRMGYEYYLVCPSKSSKTNASECWRRFRTTCNDDGYMSNEFVGNGNICNRNVCYCARDYSVQLPGFAESHPSTGYWVGAGTHRLVSEAGPPGPANVPTTLATVSTVATSSHPKSSST